MILLEPIEPKNINHLGKFIRFTVQSNNEIFEKFNGWKFVYSHQMSLSMQNNEFINLGINRQYVSNLSMN